MKKTLAAIIISATTLCSIYSSSFAVVNPLFKENTLNFSNEDYNPCGSPYNGQTLEQFCRGDHHNDCNAGMDGEVVEGCKHGLHPKGFCTVSNLKKHIAEMHNRLGSWVKVCQMQKHRKTSDKICSENLQYWVEHC